MRWGECNGACGVAIGQMRDFRPRSKKGVGANGLDALEIQAIDRSPIYSTFGSALVPSAAGASTRLMAS